MAISSHQQVGAAGQATMAGTGRQDGDVARRNQEHRKLLQTRVVADHHERRVAALGGGVEGLRVGEPVFVYPWKTRGCYAEYVTVQAGDVTSLPATPRKPRSATTSGVAKNLLTPAPLHEDHYLCRGCSGQYTGTTDMCNDLVICR